jgi:hypothetical protein
LTFILITSELKQKMSGDHNKTIPKGLIDS